VADRRRHYLDHASTSPPRPEVVEAMTAWLVRPAGDPSRVHAEGLTARAAVEQAREEVASLLGARSREVVFTSGATEAIAAAVSGAAERDDHQVVTAVEHSAVRESAAAAGPVTVVGVDRLGRVDPGRVVDAIRDDTSCVHVQWGNHEVGTRQPVAEVVALVRERDRDRGRRPLVHIDAAMAAGHDDIDFGSIGADLLSVSAHKFGGPPGVGALLVRRGLRLSPLLRGGDQERARRAGYENVPAIVGFGAAARVLGEDGRLGAEAVEARRLTDRVLAAVGAGSLGELDIYGDPVDRLPHVVCLGVPGIEPQAVLLGLDRLGVAAHSGSACASEGLEPSPVLEAMGVDAHRSLRVSTGWSSTGDDIDALLDALPRVTAELRALGAQARAQR
jgi:cysteine desulfurase